MVTNSLVPSALFSVWKLYIHHTPKWHRTYVCGNKIISFHFDNILSYSRLHISGHFNKIIVVFLVKKSCKSPENQL